MIKPELSELTVVEVTSNHFETSIQCSQRSEIKNLKENKYNWLPKFKSYINDKNTCKQINTKKVGLNPSNSASNCSCFDLFLFRNFMYEMYVSLIKTHNLPEQRHI